MREKRDSDMQHAAPTEHEAERPSAAWLAACVGITAIAAVTRFYALAMKPLHHDEGVNGYFLTTLFREGTYKYDPANYHGPTLYYIALAFAKTFGLETVPVRVSMAIWGVLTVVLCFFLARYIGRTGSLFAGLFVALSPGMIFISRYFIHEIFFVFLSLAFVTAAVYFVENRRAGIFSIVWLGIVLLTCFLPSTLSLAASIAGESTTSLWALRAGFFLVEAILVFVVVRMIVSWNEGRPIYFLLAAACVALLFATKETAFITLGTMAIACVCVWIWMKVRRPANEDAGDDEIRDTGLAWENFSTAMGSGIDRVLLLVAGAALVIYLIVLFFSSFFTYPEGVRGFIDAYAIWTRTGSKDHTQNGRWAYIAWGMKLEGPIMILSAIGAAISVLRGRHRFALFTALWAFGLLAAYTLIPYKTPWLALNFLLPMCIIAGYAIGQAAAMASAGARYAAYAAGGIAALILAYQAYDLNAVRYDDDSMPYVYAHTRREFIELDEKIKYYAEKSGKGNEAVIEVVSSDYWPMVWYLKDFPKANFHGRIVDASEAEMIVAKKDEQDADVIRKYSARYAYAGAFDLRPGVKLVLLVRKDLADPDAQEVYRIRSP